ncbi:lysophospholipid acyltransferase family protein [Algiphilus aromaticivorans]|uniref:lysophospholipid acyltransferase family protein n=1 Tax=Algiphilus aromaticivorans TaxID=382454 RepID=UPI0006948435|nr:lysophospholipid acyltransferase family protein [Algiphilus aromaticivorans]
MRHPAALARGVWRALCIVVLLGVAGFMALAVAVSPRPLPPEPLTAWWMRQLLGVLRVRVRCSGSPAAPDGLVVANHVSWLDIAVIAGLLPGRFVAKSEVRDWPLIGALAAAAGSYFIRRGSNATQALTDRMEPRLRAGGRIVLFPEGTTTAGDSVRRFHPRLFAAAANVSAVIQPLALRYGRAPDGRNVAPFVGDDAFLPHLLQLLGLPGLEVQVMLAPAFIAKEERGALARRARAAVADALAETPSEPFAPAVAYGREVVTIAGQGMPPPRGAR